MRKLRGCVTLVAALGCAGSMALPAVASGADAAAGAKYTGNSGACAPSIHRQCVFKFRVSKSGHKLRYVKKGKAVTSWACQGGGGEAIFGSGKYETPVPVARIHADGTFSGKDSTGTKPVRITGTFSKSGNKATLKFKSANHCHTPLLTLHKR